MDKDSLDREKTRGEGVTVKAEGRNRRFVWWEEEREGNDSVWGLTEMLSNRRNVGLVPGRESAWRNGFGKEVRISRKKRKRNSLVLVNAKFKDTSKVIPVLILPCISQ